MPDEKVIKDIAVVLVAAGRGERAGSPSEGPKQYRSIGGERVITRTIRALLHHPRISCIIAVIHADDDALFHQSWPVEDLRVRVVPGGATRQESTLLGLNALKAQHPPYVMIHDAARPFVALDLLERIADSLDAEVGVLPALPVADTIKKSRSTGEVSHTISRNGLYAAQTPQAFAFSSILEAHEKALQSGKADFTDDASIAEFAGLRVKIVEGSPDNVKLTWKRDIEMADERLSIGHGFPDIRVGNGYDVHALEPGDHVVLCGVKIAHNAKLAGHSDADVALHALTDALLATRGAGDIGSHFPPSDPQWKGAASRIFVERAAVIVKEAGGRIANVDVTLICEAPKIGPHRAEMTLAIADMLNLSLDRVSVKATTNEKLGFIGRNEGIAAIATASVVYPGNLK